MQSSANLDRWESEASKVGLGGSNVVVRSVALGWMVVVRSLFVRYESLGSVQKQKRLPHATVVSRSKGAESRETDVRREDGLAKDEEKELGQAR